MSETITESQLSGQAIRNRRESLGLRQADLLRLITETGLQMSPATLRNVESGNRGTSWSELAIIASCMQTTVQALLHQELSRSLLAGDPAPLIATAGGTYKASDLIASLRDHHISDQLPSSAERTLAGNSDHAAATIADPELAAICEDTGLTPAQASKAIRRAGYDSASHWAADILSQYENLPDLTPAQQRAIKGAAIRSISTQIQGGTK